MELKKVDAGVWVKASEELSLHYEDVFIQWNGSKIVAYYDNSIKQYRSGTRVYNISEVEWLKPIEQVYPLTEGQLYEFSTLLLADIAFELKTNGGYGGEQVKQFIQSLNK